MEETPPDADIKDITLISFMFISGQAIQFRILRTKWEKLHRDFYNMDIRVIETDPQRTSYPLRIGSYRKDGSWAGNVYLNLFHVSLMKEIYEI